MQEKTIDTLKDCIHHGEIIQDFIQHKGFGLLMVDLLDRITELNDKMKTSTDSGLIACCFKELQGLNFIRDWSSEIMARAERASERLDRERLAR
jgi:hypothetical protein